MSTKGWFIVVRQVDTEATPQPTQVTYSVCEHEYLLVCRRVSAITQNIGWRWLLCFFVTVRTIANLHLLKLLQLQRSWTFGGDGVEMHLAMRRRTCNAVRSGSVTVVVLCIAVKSRCFSGGITHEALRLLFGHQTKGTRKYQNNQTHTYSDSDEGESFLLWEYSCQ